MKSLLLTRKEVASLLSIEDSMKAVQEAFRLKALNKVAPPGILGVHASDGGFHIKAGIMNLGRNYFVAKTNGNFPDNPKKFNLPTIQGIILVCDADNGRVLAVMDSIEITIIRTGAATGVAANWLAKKNARTLLICGCGNQGRISLRAISAVRDLSQVYVYDNDGSASGRFVSEQAKSYPFKIEAVSDFKPIVSACDIVVTCTPSKNHFISADMIGPGTFIAAVGSDNEQKQEIAPDLLKTSKLVCDSIDQCSTIGELHHAIQANSMSKENVHGELGDIIAGKRVGRANNNEVIVFDSTGTALQDVASAAIVYERALDQKRGTQISFIE